MKTRALRTTLLVIAILILLAVSFILGGVCGARRAAYASDAATLVWLGGIHKALAAGNAERARQVTDQAVDANIGVLHEIETIPLSPLLYALPWSWRFDRSTNRHFLSNTQKYFKDYPTELQPETRAFLEKYNTP